ncbi:MAG: DUF115 domain-containing protein [Bacillota bacterium]|nr:DUF115 domain-containing protein [Bacillota bacterium]
MNEVLQRNLKLLEKHQPNVFKKLTLYLKNQYRPLNNFIDKIVIARQDEIIINMLVTAGGREFLICNHEDPIGEAYNWIDKFIDPSNKADVVFGIGFGYHLEVLLTGFKNKKVILIEPDIQLFYQIICIRNLELIIKKSEIFLDEQMDIVLDRLNLLLWDTEAGGIQCEPFEVYGYMFESLWDELRNKFIKQAQNFNVDFSTKKVYGELWTSNSISNAAKLNEAANLQGLIGNFRNIPGILVSAGPSLKKNIPLLKELKNKAIIMAAGTAVAILEENGITPNFMVGIDASAAEAELHKKVISKDIYFIYTNQIAKGSIESYKGPKFFMNYPVDLYSAELLKYCRIKSDCVLSGPSVANTCADLLYKMGCNPIVLVGQDLAYTNIKVDDKNNKDPNMIIDRDVYGNLVYTSTVFVSMRNWFEGYFEKIKADVELLNVTEGGLNIENTVNCALRDVVKRLENMDFDIDGKISNIYNKSRFSKELATKFNEFKSKLSGEITKFERLFEEQDKIVDSISKDIYHPAKNRIIFEKMTRRVSEITDLLLDSTLYNIALKNIVDIDFYIIKLEVERATKELNDYNEVKAVFTDAMKRQVSLEKEKTKFIKECLDK